MSQKPLTNVKIYDRPERKAVSPSLVALIALIVLAIAFFAYRALHHPAAVPASNSQSRLLPAGTHRPAADTAPPGTESTIESQAGEKA